MNKDERGFIEITTTGSNTGYAIYLKEETIKAGSCKYSLKEVITWIS